MIVEIKEEYAQNDDDQSIIPPIVIKLSPLLNQATPHPPREGIKQNKICVDEERDNSLIVNRKIL